MIVKSPFDRPALFDWHRGAMASVYEVFHSQYRTYEGEQCRMSVIHCP